MPKTYKEIIRDIIDRYSRTNKSTLDSLSDDTKLKMALNFAKAHKLPEYKVLYKFAKEKRPIVLVQIQNEDDDIREVEEEDK